MPIIRINAVGDAPGLHTGPGSIRSTLTRAAAIPGPVIVLVHGYKYLPGHKRHCPHRHILSLAPQENAWRTPSWPRLLGFGAGDRAEGLAIAFGWDARGALWQARKRAVAAGKALSAVVRALHPGRPVHVMAHSLGIEPVLESLYHLPEGAIGRIISMTGACYQGRAQQALNTPAGRTAEFFNITSRENDPFDFLFERLIAPPSPGDRAIGHGLKAANALTLQMDCPGTLHHLGRLGFPIAAPERRICHWSTYTRSGAMPFYRELLRRPGALTLTAIRAGLPAEPAPRWSRLTALPAVPLPFATLRRPGKAG